jgi:hypothetical protein
MKIKKRPFQKGENIKAHEASNISPEQQPPIFSLHYICKGYCISDCTKDEKAAFADTIRKLSQCTWLQLKQSDRHKLGYEIIDKNSIRAPIPSHITEDVNIIAFRFCSLAPMVGYRDRAIFHVIWLDRAYSLYPH